MLRGKNASEYNPSININAGIFVKQTVNDNIYLQPELLYFKRGAILKSARSRVDVFLNYLDFNFLGGYYFSDLISLEFGPKVAYLISNKAKSSRFNEHRAITEYNKIDYGLMAGVNIDFISNTSFFLRYYHGISELDKLTDGHHNRNLSLGMTLKLNGQ